MKATKAHRVGGPVSLQATTAGKFIGAICMLLAAALGLPVTEADAVESGCAVVLPTSDGFVAVRSGPSVSSPMLERLVAGQIIRFATSGGFPRKWWRVDALLKIESGRISTIREMDGWTSESLLQMIDCG